MPNIVITEGLDTPWELKDTESNITAATDLTSINLANQTVGTLAYTSSQLLGSLKTEKNNLDNIVDAIELINEEIALFPGRIAAWDTAVEKTTISDNVLGKMQIPLVKNDFVAINFPNILAVQDGASLTDTSLKYATAGYFSSPPGDESSQIIQTASRSKLDALLELTVLKPALDTANIQINSNQIGYLFPTPVETQSNQSSSGDLNYWRMTNSIVEGGTDTSVAGTNDQLVVYRGADGEPTNYKYFYMTYEEVRDPSDPFSTIRQPILKNVEVSPDRLLPFAVPMDSRELNSWRLTLNYPQNLIDATNSLLNNTGLPEGVTPPVTTLGLSVEKYIDSAIYTTVVPGYRPWLSPPPEVIYGAYPPLSPATFDLTKITKADANKFFQDPNSSNIYYIANVSDTGVVDYRFVTAKEPFINKMTDDIKKTLRGEYAEKQILLTQRSTDQTLFVTSITQRYTTFSDMATNLLKTLVNFYNDLARNLRG
ncbi:hypothetical protein MCEGEM3_02011 [Oxalobacteraceae bacterium]